MAKITKTYTCNDVCMRVRACISSKRFECATKWLTKVERDISLEVLAVAVDGVETEMVAKFISSLGFDADVSYDVYTLLLA